MKEFIDVDVRPILRAGGEPFSTIMTALASLQPGQGLRLFATFKPVPLFGVMVDKGFAHEETELQDGEWEILFRPVDAPTPARVVPSVDEWPDPIVRLDNRDLDPPEPMVRILAAIETLSPGQIMSAQLRREPVFLFPELEKRGHSWRGGFTPDGTAYELTVRIAG